MSSTDGPMWSFLTNHARVLLCIAQDPGIRLREIGERVAITERAAHRIVDDLVEAGFVSRTRFGRRNRYAVDLTRPIWDRLAQERSVGDLLAILAPPDPDGAELERADGEADDPQLAGRASTR